MSSNARILSDWPNDLVVHIVPGDVQIFVYDRIHRRENVSGARKSNGRHECDGCSSCHTRNNGRRKGLLLCTVTPLEVSVSGIV
jgi:hypothetical protein